MNIAVVYSGELIVDEVISDSYVYRKLLLGLQLTTIIGFWIFFQKRATKKMTKGAIFLQKRFYRNKYSMQNFAGGF